MSAVFNNRGFVLTLYRNILKEHKLRLPSTMRHLGDEYVKKEFRLHKDAKVEQVNAFVQAWTNYLTILRLKDESFGAELERHDFEALSDEQRGKLDELKAETRKAVKEVIKDIEERDSTIRPKIE